MRGIGAIVTRILLATSVLAILGYLLFMYGDLQLFAKRGPRFTAYDGQELCLRVQAIEKRLGDSGECNYGK